MTTTQATQDNAKRGKVKKSCKLNPSERKAIKEYAKEFDTDEEVADEIGIKRTTYLRIKELGRCNSDTKNIILNHLILKGIISKQITTAA